MARVTFEVRFSISELIALNHKSFLRAVVEQSEFDEVHHIGYSLIGIDEGQAVLLIDGETALEVPNNASPLHVVRSSGNESGGSNSDGSQDRDPQAVSVRPDAETAI